jgi:hypothetical protein
MESCWIYRIGILIWTTRMSLLREVSAPETSSLDVKEQASMKLKNFALTFFCQWYLCGFST